MLDNIFLNFYFNVRLKPVPVAQWYLFILFTFLRHFGLFTYNSQTRNTSTRFFVLQNQVLMMSYAH